MLYCIPELICAYTAIALHELSHALVSIKLRHLPTGLYAGIFGMKLEVPEPLYFRDKILIYSAGPVASMILYILTKLVLILFFPNSYYLSFFALANLSASLINLIPIAPLDGASILMAVLTKHLGIIKGKRIIRKISAFFYVFFSFVNLCFVVLGIFNPGLFLFFLFSSRFRNELECSEDIKNILSGKIQSSKKIRLISCDSESELLSLASLISADYSLLFAVFCNDRFLKELHQSDIIHGINTYGALCTAIEYIHNEYGL